MVQNQNGGQGGVPSNGQQPGGVGQNSGIANTLHLTHNYMRDKMGNNNKSALDTDEGGTAIRKH